MKLKNSIALHLAFYIALCSIVTLSSCSDDDTPETTTPTLELSENATLGEILTDDEGITLYYFAKDVDGQSACEGACESTWPVFYEVDLAAGPGVSSGGIGVITRADGSKQNTYKGWPLYYFSGDAAAGDANGEGVTDNWFVAKKDYDLFIAQQDIDDATVTYLVDDRGNSLYFFTVDDVDVSNCNDGCLDTWPPLSLSPAIVPSTLDINKFKTIDGNNGSDQTSFDGKPLYFFNQDARRGEVKGQGVGGSWFVLDGSLFN